MRNFGDYERDAEARKEGRSMKISDHVIELRVLRDLTKEPAESPEIRAMRTRRFEQKSREFIDMMIRRHTPRTK
jgi:hypothetical protein